MIFQGRRGGAGTALAISPASGMNAAGLQARAGAARPALPVPAAADIDRDALQATDALDGATVGTERLLTLPKGRREVHHMDPVGTSCCEVTRHGQRVIRVDVHLRPIAAREAHHLAGDEIDGGKQDQLTQIGRASCRERV